MKISTGFVLLLGLCLSSCEKYKYEDDQTRLPRESKNGRGMFACYIDETTYITKRQKPIVYNINTGYLFLTSVNYKFEFRLFVYSGIFSEGIYQFDITGEDFVSWNSDQIFFGIDPEGINELVITKLDPSKEIISGRFNIDLKASDGTKKYIRDGRFDLEISVIG